MSILKEKEVIDGTTFRACIKQADKDRKAIMREWYRFKRKYNEKKNNTSYI